MTEFPFQPGLQDYRWDRLINHILFIIMFVVLFIVLFAMKYNSIAILTRLGARKYYTNYIYYS